MQGSLRHCRYFLELFALSVIYHLKHIDALPQFHYQVVGEMQLFAYDIQCEDVCHL
jgi:hypothetical protein